MLHATCYTLRSTRYMLDATCYTLHTTRYMLHTERYMLDATFYTLLATRYVLHATCCTLHATRYRLHATRYLLHTTCYTLHATRCTFHTLGYKTLHCHATCFIHWAILQEAEGFRFIFSEDEFFGRRCSDFAFAANEKKTKAINHMVSRAFPSQRITRRVSASSSWEP
ncbi:dynein heavy chain [Elysia marginata]|uniref:Dynein heavy chain n=1 Tax=Elysia marginata TaxID=1093978 RepID=A0AAV4EK14_9GAST|nr:dynein heavy chain [Elysia marginata]